MKTVHGAEFYANKRHKGTPSHPSSSDDGHGGTSNASGGFDSSPRSTEDNGVKNASVSSPSIKSESDVMINQSDGFDGLAGGRLTRTVNRSPDQQAPIDCDRLTLPAAGIGGSVQLFSDSVSAIDDPAWPYEDEDLEVLILLPFVVYNFRFLFFF